MPLTTISDTSCLILLDKIQELALLYKLFKEVTITSTIQQEFNKKLPEWIRVRDPENKQQLMILQGLLDPGEASGIALALEERGSLLIVDDLKGRKVAEQLGVNFTGTLGIIADAKNSGIIDSVKPILEKIKNTNFRISSQVEQQLLLLVKE